MKRKVTFQQTIKLAQKDETLSLIAKSILASNRARTPDRTAYCAFADRCEELGLVFANDFYRSLLVAPCAGVAK